MKTFFDSVDALWPEYLAHHRDPRNRALHFSADGVVLAGVGAAILLGRPSLAVGAIATGYAMVFAGHAIEGNRPLTLSRPVAAAISNWRMFALGVSGRLDRELERLEAA